MTAARWTDQDFDRMSWHDNHVHALRVFEGEHGAGELWLELDYILEWLKEDQGLLFRIVPVQLRFADVSSLRVTLDYATVTAAMGPFSVASIERTFEVRARYTASLWKIIVNWPVGEIEFEASGFEQVPIGGEVLSRRQVLTPQERGDA